MKSGMKNIGRDNNYLEPDPKRMMPSSSIMSKASFIRSASDHVVTIDNSPHKLVITPVVYKTGSIGWAYEGCIVVVEGGYAFDVHAKLTFTVQKSKSWMDNTIYENPLSDDDYRPCKKLDLEDEHIGIRPPSNYSKKQFFDTVRMLQASVTAGPTLNFGLKAMGSGNVGWNAAGQMKLYLRSDEYNSTSFRVMTTANLVVIGSKEWDEGSYDSIPSSGEDDIEPVEKLSSESDVTFGDYTTTESP